MPGFREATRQRTARRRIGQTQGHTGGNIIWPKAKAQLRAVRGGRGGAKLATCPRRNTSRHPRHPTASRHTTARHTPAPQDITIRTENTGQSTGGTHQRHSHGSDCGPNIARCPKHRLRGPSPRSIGPPRHSCCTALPNTALASTAVPLLQYARARARACPPPGPSTRDPPTEKPQPDHHTTGTTHECRAILLYASPSSATTPRTVHTVVQHPLPRKGGPRRTRHIQSCAPSRPGKPRAQRRGAVRNPLHRLPCDITPGAWPRTRVDLHKTRSPSSAMRLRMGPVQT
mmetsp:Transcript_22410/g.35562  ORF Transcript_22410/g.35562 Transcript_22410/m.35562 type:complete len:287 (-) Transcript_22410:309-1169(-)